MAKVVGIDLGMTNACVAVMEGDKPIVIANAEGFGITPCVVAYGNHGQRLIGQSAKRQAAINPENTFHSVSFIGRKYNTNWIEKVANYLQAAMVKQGCDRGYSLSHESQIVLIQLNHVVEQQSVSFNTNYYNPYSSSDSSADKQYSSINSSDDDFIDAEFDEID